MLPLTFTVSGEPKSQPRVKAMRCGGFIRIYTPKTADEWKGLVASAARPFLPAEPIRGPLRLSLAFRFKRPASHLTSKGALTKSAPTAHISKPDTDNLGKAIMDTLTDVGLWKDDCQVVDLRATKTYDADEGVTINLEQFFP